MVHRRVHGTLSVVLAIQWRCLRGCCSKCRVETGAGTVAVGANMVAVGAVGFTVGAVGSPGSPGGALTGGAPSGGRTGGALCGIDTTTRGSGSEAGAMAVHLRLPAYKRIAVAQRWGVS